MIKFKCWCIKKNRTPDQMLVPLCHGHSPLYTNDLSVAFQAPTRAEALRVAKTLHEGLTAHSVVKFDFRFDFFQGEVVLAENHP